VAWPDFLDWRAQNQAFDRMAVFQPNRLRFRGSGEPRLIPAGYVSADFFPLLGARPLLGRTFDEVTTTQAVVSYTIELGQRGGPDRSNIMRANANLSTQAVVPRVCWRTNHRTR
jgi:hypothetical protein